MTQAHINGSNPSLSRPLVEFLSGDAATAQSAAQTLTENQLWSDALRLSFDWRVTPHFWRQVQALPVALPEATRKEIAALCRMVSIKSTTAAHRSRQVLTHLADANIPAIAFKGIGVMASLYGKPSDRMVGDLDLLITPDVLPATCQSLQSLGYEPVIAGDLKNYLAYLDHRTRQDNLFLIFKDRSGFEIDLHWGLKAIGGHPFPVTDVIGRAVQAELMGQCVTVASPTDAMLLATHHSVRDDFAPPSSVKDLCDLQTWWTQSQNWSIEVLVKQAQQVGLLLPLLAMWTLLAAYNPTEPITTGISILRQSLSAAERTQADHLVLLFRLQLDGETINRNLLHSLSWTTLTRFIKRRFQQQDTLSFDQTLWGIESESRLSVSKRQGLFKALQRLNTRKLNAYRTLAALQNQIKSD